MQLRLGGPSAGGRPLWRPLVTALVLVGASVVIPRGAVLAYSCATPDTYFMGTEVKNANVKGSQANIEYVNEQLCSGGASFSAYWTSVIGDDPSDVDGWNIYQIGVDECHLVAVCPINNPWDTPYYFFAYGHMDSTSCGPAVAPSPQEFAGTPSGTRNYKVIREFVSGGGGYWSYAVKLDNQVKDRLAETALTTCWNGVDGVQIMNESFNTATQAGGPNSNYQDFESPRWHNGSAWQVISRPAGTNCDFGPSPSRGCKWSTVTPDTWRSWDTRF